MYVREFFRNNRLNVFLTLLVYVTGAGLNVGVSWFLQVLTDTITRTAAYSFAALLRISVVILAIILLYSVQSAIVYPRFLETAMRQYKDFAFQKLLQKNIASFAVENTSGYISAFTNDAISIEDHDLKNIFKIIQYAVMFVASLTLMFFYSVPMTVIVLALVALPMLVSLLTGNKLADKETLVSRSNERYVAAIKDILSGFSVIKSFQAEKEAAAMFASSNQTLEAAKKSRNRTAEIIEKLSAVAYILTQLGTMLTGAWFVLNGKGGLTAGMLLSFINLVNFVVQPIGALPGLLGQRKAANALIDKLAQNLQHNIEDRTTDIAPVLREGIRIDALSYSYEEGKRVLDHISCKFEPGKSYAVVGESGSGKSTLLHLLMGADPGYEGSITIDGIESRQISARSLFELLSLIQQNVFIFNASIRDNICMFKAFPQKDVERVIHLSGLDKLIAEKGEAYLCGENGNKLSGGEKQRIAIARTLLKKSSVLLVDEATSSLDNETASNVSRAILHLQHLTRIVVTHRLEGSLLNQYDGLIVLKDGAIVEEGRFQDLMEQKGYFYSLYMVSQ